jgi:hypothetical protein
MIELFAVIAERVHLIGGEWLNSRRIARFWSRTSMESMPLMVVATGRLMA